MRRAIVVIIVYRSKLRLRVWRAARRLRLSNRLSSPLSVMLVHLIIRTNEISHSFRYFLPTEVENDSVESCKMPEAL